MLLLAVLDRPSDAKESYAESNLRSLRGQGLFLMFKLLLNLYILQFVLSQNFPEEELLIVQETCPSSSRRVTY